MSRPGTPKKHSTKPITATKRAELLAIKKFRDVYKLPQTDNDLFKHVGVSRSAGYRIFKEQPQELHSNSPCEETRGRRPALSEVQITQMITFLRNNYEACTLPWAAICNAAGLEFPNQPPTSYTIRKHLNKRGWKKCNVCWKLWVDYDTAFHRETFAREALAREAFAREAFAREALETYGLDFSYWRRIRYSDEVHFEYGPEGKVVIAQRSGERYNHDCVHDALRPTEAEDGQGCLSAWAAIGWNFKSRLVWYSVKNKNGTMTLQAYRDQVLEPEVKRWIAERHDFILEEDGAEGHGGNSDHNIVRQWKQNHGLEYFFDSPGPPDLAPIANLWRAPKGQVRRQAMWDIGALRRAAEQGWANLSQDTVNKWVEEVPKRLLAVTKAKE